MAKDFKVISDFYDLVNYLGERVEKFPRHQRYNLGAAIERRCQDLLAQLIRARYAGQLGQRADILADINVELEVLRFQLRLARDRKALPSQSHGHAIHQLAEVGAQVGGWLKASRPAPAVSQ